MQAAPPSAEQQLLRSPRPIRPATYSGHICRLALCPSCSRNSFSPRASSISQCGRAYRAVFASEDLSFDGETKAAATVKPSARRVLYYRNPMGLADVSKSSKKDAMGMDYIPVYEGADDDGEAIKLSPGKLQRIGVKSETAIRRVIAEPVRAPGSIQLDERRIAVISVRAESFIETVENVTTGSEVKSGEPLMRIYSPAVAAAAAQYLSNPNAQGSAQRLLNFAVPQQLLADIERTKQVPMTFTWTAPRDGTCLNATLSKASA